MAVITGRRTVWKTKMKNRVRIETNGDKTSVKHTYDHFLRKAVQEYIKQANY